MSDDERKFVISFTKRHEEMISEIKKSVTSLETQVGDLCVETQAAMDEFGTSIAEDIGELRTRNQELTKQLANLTRHFYAQQKEIGYLRLRIAKPEVIEIDSDNKSDSEQESMSGAHSEIPGDPESEFDDKSESETDDEARPPVKKRKVSDKN